MTQQARRSGLACEPGPQRERVRANHRMLCAVLNSQGGANDFLVVQLN